MRQEWISKMGKKWISKMTLTDVMQDENFIYAYNTFLDEFRSCSNKEELIQPPRTTVLIEKENLCILVAAVHKLANEANITVPDWVFDSKYILEEPIFAFDTEDKDFQDMLVKDTPIEFASRNIFYGPKVTSRC